MDAPISLAERAKINAQNQARYDASEQAKLDAQEAKRLARQAGLAARQARMKETSCGSVEQTGNPRAGCDCQTCQRRRKTKTTRQRAKRHRDRDDDLEWIESGGHDEYRKERFSRYNLTEADYFALLAAQGGGCAICGAKSPGGRGKGSAAFHVDHDHTCCPGQESCGKCVRGLLCANCNTGLGYFKDSPERLLRAAEYLKTED